MIQRTIWIFVVVGGGGMFNPLYIRFFDVYKETRVFWQDYEKKEEPVLIKFSAEVRQETRNNLEHFRDVAVNILNTGFFSIFWIRVW